MAGTRTNVSTVNRGPLPDVPGIDVEHEAAKTDNPATYPWYVQLRPLSTTPSTREADNTTPDDDIDERNTSDVTEDLHLKPVEANSRGVDDSVVETSTGGDSGITQDASTGSDSHDS